MKTPIQKVLEEIKTLKKNNPNRYQIVVFNKIERKCEELLPEEQRVIETAFANGYLKTKSAKEYYQDNFDPKQLNLFEE